ncbi:MAG: hypothetical protein JWO80_6238 [Bryobacterales bacterium]|nr:hypothetical protein [Bryobacterales bacterium]
MKTFLALIAIPACLIPACLAQRYTAPGRVVFTNPSGFGNVAFPGTGTGPQATFSYRLGQTVAGNPVGYGNGNGARRSRVYAYPVFIGGGYYTDPSAYGYAGQGQGQPPVNVTVVNAPPQVPGVVINQNFGPPQQPDTGASETTHVYQPPPPAPDNTADAPQQPHYFLIAFKDHSVYSALAYWIEDKTLHYVTPQQTHNQASLDLIDLDFTNKLNQR